MLRLLYFSGVAATACWLMVLLYRRLLAVRTVNVIVDSPERTANIKALEKAWSVDENSEEP